MKRSEIECERINTKPHYQNRTSAAALNHVFTCTQCTVYVQYMCINSAALNHVFTCTQCTVYVQYMCINSVARNKTANAGKKESRKGLISDKSLKFLIAV